MPEDTDDPSHLGGPPFAERLRFLIDNVHPRGRGPYSQTEVVDMIRAGGGRMTTGYLSQLLSGKRKAPSLPTVTELATFFRVPIDYFGPEDSYRTVREHIEWMCSVRDSGVEEVAARTYDPRQALGMGLDRLRRGERPED